MSRTPPERASRHTHDPLRMRDLLPRKVAGLPPGQREIRAFPRFSDKPLRWAPKPAPIELTVAIEGRPIEVYADADLARFAHVDQVTDFHCVTTWTRRGVQWGGIRFSELARAAVGPELPRHLTAYAADHPSAVFLTADLDAENVLLATELDGAPLDPRHGAPLRLVSPGQYGYKNVKHLVMIDFCEAEPPSTLGSKEHLRARVVAEERHASLPNWAVRIPYRLSIGPTALAAERGLRRSPGHHEAGR